MPVLLLFTSPLIVMALWEINVLFEGSVLLWAAELPGSLFDNLPRPTLKAAGVLGGFTVFQFALLVLLPGAGFLASVTPQGNRPWYKLNGCKTYLATHAVLLALHVSDTLNVTWIFTHFGEFLVTSSALSIALCVLLYFKGIYLPSTNDSGRTGFGVVWDFWWGTELHPTLFGFNIKQLINCRVSMTGWQMLCWCAVAYQHEVYGYVGYGLLVSAALQFVYLLKFFWWEDGYFNSMDIQHDRFGYYICWGVLNWVPGLYPYASMSLAARAPDTFTLQQAATLFAVGCFCIWANYDADRQRMVARANPRAIIWGKPAKLIEAHYTTGDGKKNKSLLLYSGWWGTSRHFHYIAEIAACICWSWPVGFELAAAWVYVVFLTILLLDRAYRDELRCSKKYGKHWAEYCKKVPYRVIPYIY
jgi:7-dehydrocholesterol reductase